MLIFAALAGGLAAPAWQARAAARDAAKACAVTAFVVSLSQLAHPSNAQGASISAREMLDRGAARVRDELSGQPEVHAELLRPARHNPLRAGIVGRAEQQLREARAAPDVTARR